MSPLITGVDLQTLNAALLSSRYLIPCNHMMLSQRWAVKERDCYSVSASSCSPLTPVCCSSGITLTLGNQEGLYPLAEARMIAQVGVLPTCIPDPLSDRN